MHVGSWHNELASVAQHFVPANLFDQNDAAECTVHVTSNLNSTNSLSAVRPHLVRRTSLMCPWNVFAVRYVCASLDAQSLIVVAEWKT